MKYLPDKLFEILFGWTPGDLKIKRVSSNKQHPADAWMAFKINPIYVRHLTHPCGHCSLKFPQGKEIELEGKVVIFNKISGEEGFAVDARLSHFAAGMNLAGKL